MVRQCKCLTEGCEGYIVFFINNIASADDNDEYEATCKVCKTEYIGKPTILLRKKGE